VARRAISRYAKPLRCILGSYLVRPEAIIPHLPGKSKKKGKASAALLKHFRGSSVSNTESGKIGLMFIEGKEGCLARIHIRCRLPDHNRHMHQSYRIIPCPGCTHPILRGYRALQAGDRSSSRSISRSSVSSIPGA
jgi:hypothetical protein